MNTDAITLLSKQLDEHHQYARTNIQLLTQWFIFFATANYVVLGYFGLKITDGTFASPIAFHSVAGLFFVVNTFGMILCWQARKWFISTGAAAQTISSSLRAQTDLSSEPPQALLVWSVYARVMVLMILTIASMFLTWLVMLFAVLSISTRPGNITLPWHSLF